ncbi:hypothetical protein AVEN_76324-1 [Araneus ventricosus]|uniref:Uncharacterized protein n=1 Tax=Araneus ventricosus TaxID=182803 RepID=A0A4Y2MFQ8_ARAVE|nr:hypothetical protein AVEN_30751-1 [Araneus ventricosus]GBN25999.1 hypothetical protein AVEN_76324-1 [Araneus ventricosus]
MSTIILVQTKNTYGIFVSDHFSPNLANKNPGKLSYARWLTTAKRLLRLYKSTREPPQKFKEISMFIIKVYTPMWFYMNCNLTVMEAPDHLHGTISFSRYLSNELRITVDTTIQ